MENVYFGFGFSELNFERNWDHWASCGWQTAKSMDALGSKIDDETLCFYCLRLRFVIFCHGAKLSQEFALRPQGPAKSTLPTQKNPFRCFLLQRRTSGWRKRRPIEFLSSPRLPSFFEKSIVTFSIEFERNWDWGTLIWTDFKIDGSAATNFSTFLKLGGRFLAETTHWIAFYCTIGLRNSSFAKHGCNWTLSGSLISSSQTTDPWNVTSSSSLSCYFCFWDLVFCFSLFFVCIGRKESAEHPLLRPTGAS